MSFGDVVFTRAQAYANSQGYRFGDGAARMVEEMAYRAQGTGAPLDEAEAALRRFIDEMIRASREIPHYAEQHPDVIGEHTFVEAQMRLCPLFPIC